MHDHQEDKIYLIIILSTEYSRDLKVSMHFRYSSAVQHRNKDKKIKKIGTTQWRAYDTAATTNSSTKLFSYTRFNEAHRKLAQMKMNYILILIKVL